MRRNADGNCLANSEGSLDPLHSPFSCDAKKRAEVCRTHALSLLGVFLNPDAGLMPLNAGFMPLKSLIERGLSQWFAGQTRSQCDDLALHHSANQQLHVFCSPVRICLTIGRRWVERLEPLLRRHVSAHLDLSRDRWSPIIGLVYVARVAIIEGKGYPATLKNGPVGQWSGFASDGHEARFDNAHPAGNKVRAMTGLSIDRCSVIDPDRVIDPKDVLRRSAPD